MQINRQSHADTYNVATFYIYAADLCRRLQLVDTNFTQVKFHFANAPHILWHCLAIQNRHTNAHESAYAHVRLQNWHSHAYTPSTFTHTHACSALCIANWWQLKAKANGRKDNYHKVWQCDKYGSVNSLMHDIAITMHTWFGIKTLIYMRIHIYIQYINKKKKKRNAVNIAWSYNEFS